MSDHDGVGELSLALFELFRTMGRATACVGRDGENGIAALPLLLVLGHHEPMRLQALAAKVQLDTSTASRHVTYLIAKGLVERRPDPEDRRAALLAVTPAGRDKLVRVRAYRERLVGDITADWDDADRARLATLLSRLTEACVAHLAPGADSLAEPAVPPTGVATMPAQPSPTAAPRAVTADADPSLSRESIA